MGLGLRSVLLFSLFSLSLHAEARVSRFSKLMRAIGCGALLMAQPKVKQLEQIRGFLGEHAKLTVDAEDETLTHVQAHIYSSKLISTDSVSADATDEFNFFVSSEGVSVQLMDARMSNRAFRILQKLPEHFKYVRKEQTEFVFDVQFLPHFIAEVRSLSYEFY